MAEEIDNSAEQPVITRKRAAIVFIAGMMWPVCRLFQILLEVRFGIYDIMFFAHFQSDLGIFIPLDFSIVCGFLALYLINRGNSDKWRSVVAALFSPVWAVGFVVSLSYGVIESSLLTLGVISGFVTGFLFEYAYDLGAKLRQLSQGNQEVDHSKGELLVFCYLGGSLVSNLMMIFLNTLVYSLFGGWIIQ